MRQHAERIHCWLGMLGTWRNNLRLLVCAASHERYTQCSKHYLFKFSALLSSDWKNCSRCLSGRVHCGTAASLFQVEAHKPVYNVD